MKTGPYPIPDSNDPKQWNSCLVLSYKVIKGVEFDDRYWDIPNWSRSAKAAKTLLDICGSLRAADACMVELGGSFEEKGLAWTLETVCRHANDWINKKRGTNGNAARQRLFDALAEQRAKTMANGDGEGLKPIRNPIRGLRKVSLPREKDSNTGTRSSDG